MTKQSKHSSKRPKPKPKSKPKAKKVKKRSKPKPKPGKSYKSQAVLPNRASIDTKIAHKIHNKLSDDTLSAYRSGFRSMWETVPKTMKECKIKPRGSYDPKNCHKGEMWGWPFEMNLTTE